MKKSFLIMITLVCCLALAAGILTACNSNEGTQTGGQNSGWSSSSDGVISIAGGTIDGEEIFMLVESSVDSVSLASRVKCAEGMIWRLYHDNLGQQEIPTKIAAGNNGRLNNGNNVFYIVVTSTDATRVSVYSLTIHRSYAASIRFYDGAALVYTDTAYTGYEYVVDYTPDIPGCVFHYWETADGDECSSIMLWGSVSLYANKTANVYKATLSSGYDDSVDSKIINTTYGEAFYFPVPQRVGHSFRGWYVGDEQLTSSDGRSLDVWEYTSDQTVTAKWQINSYAVALQTNISGAGELLGSGNYGYASTVNIEAEPYLGYEFAGWYDGDNLVSSQSSYTFSLPASDVAYTAKFAVRDEMSNFAFTSTFDECTITGVKDKSVTDITIPDYVTSIGDYAFSGCSGLTSVYISNIAAWCGIDFGGSYANPLSYAHNLYLNGKLVTDLVIPDSVTSIGDYAFNDCDGLTSVTIGNGVTSIGDYAFYVCSGLTSVTIPNSVTSIGDYAFMGCYKLAEVYNKSSLDITTENSENGYVAYYAKNVYTEEGGSWFTDTADGFRFFYDGTDGYLMGYYGEETAITLPDGFTAYDGTEVTEYAIYDYAFYVCSGLTFVTIPDSVTSIGSYAFYVCSGLTSVTIPNSVTSIGVYAFSGCSGLTSVYISDIAAWCGIDFGSSYANPLSYAHNLYLNGKLVTDLVIPNSVTSIGSYSFYSCDGLKSVTIGSGVTSIGDYAFMGCHKLAEVYNKSSLGITTENSENGYVAYNAKNVYTEEVGSWFTDTADGFRLFYDGTDGYLMGYYGEETAITLPDGFTAYDGTEVTEYAIYDYAFNGCTGLTSITIPDSVTSIGDHAFYVCSGLTSVTIPNSVTSIGMGAFEGCDSLESITIPFVGATKEGTSGTHFGYIFGASSSGYNENYVPTSLKEVVITGGTSILNSAFEGCSGLTSVTIPDSVTSIGSSAFMGCSGLTSVTIPDSVTSIGDYAFRYCDSLTSVYISDIAAWCGIDFGGSSANPLSYAHNLYLNGKLVTDLVIPDSVTSIGVYAFSGCSGLTSVTILDSVTSIGNYAFNGCIGLTSVTIPNSVTSISWGAFMVCTGLRSVTIGSGVTSIGSSAFSGCSGLTSVTIPDSVTSIGSYAFAYCSSLTSVTIGNGVTRIGDYAFSDCDGLTSVTIGNGVTSIGSMVFAYCYELTSVTFEGTKADWNAITKEDSWKNNSPLTEVVCSDGKVSV